VPNKQVRYAASIAAVLAAVVLGVPAVTLAAPVPGPYNDSGYNYTTGGDASATAGNSGLYQREPADPDHIRSYAGPHGGYTSTTNKCKDCHAVHYARAGVLLLRAASRDDACSFCHEGGGGSSTNIQMDNDYDADGPVAGTGSGVGHTLGATWGAPTDIKPAFRSPTGLTCFECHTPHAASTRMITTFADPGRALGGQRVSALWSGSTLLTTTPDPSGIDLATYNGGVGSYWGTTVEEGNIASALNGGVTQHPVWPKGRFLLLKDPHPTSAEGAGDTAVGTSPGTAGEEGTNKLAIDWEDPLGPADAAYGGAQDTDNDTDYYGSPGLATVSEVCTDCHDGSAGAVTQRAVVWRPAPSDPTSGSYETAWGHDAQPRDLCRAQLLDAAGGADNPDGRDDNFGPGCRQCHAGGSSCGQCHGTDAAGVPRAAYPSDPRTPEAGATPYWPQASISRSAVANLSGQCIDAGFSWPHRTLAVNMLPDEVYGVDFDGSPVAPGEYRSDPETLVTGFLADQPFASEPATTAWKPFVDTQARVATAVAENLDGVCIACHGDATYYNGGDPAFYHSGPGGSGWELILKGLP